MQSNHETSPLIKSLTEQILTAYNSKFYFINPDDILFCTEYNKKSKFIARVRVLSNPYLLLSNYRIIIEICQQNWDMLTFNQQLLVLYHELLHIDYDFEYDCYVLNAHDVEDFTEILKPFGLGWQLPGKDVPNILEKLI